jgi:hypothetical protein
MLVPVASFKLRKPLIKGGQEVETSNRCCLGYFLQAGIIFPKPPDHNSRISGAKKPQYFRGAVCPPVGGFKLHKSKGSEYDYQKSSCSKKNVSQQSGTPEAIRRK